jgi:hypothetical protein
MSYRGEKKAEMKIDIIPSMKDREKAYECILSIWPLESEICVSKISSQCFESAQSILKEVKEEIKTGSLEKAKTAFDNFIEFVNREPKTAGIYKAHIKEFEIARQNFEDFAEYMLKKEKTEVIKEVMRESAKLPENEAEKENKEKHLSDFCTQIL